MWDGRVFQSLCTLTEKGFSVIGGTDVNYWENDLSDLQAKYHLLQSCEKELTHDSM